MARPGLYAVAALALPITLISVFVLVVVATVTVLSAGGAAIGFRRRRLWVPPLVFLLDIAGLLTVSSFTKKPHTVIGAELTSCTSIPKLSSQLCASPAKEYLPHTIYLVDNAFTNVDEPMARIGLDTKRSFSVPSALPADDMSYQLGQTLAAPCRDGPVAVALFVAAGSHDAVAESPGFTGSDLEKIRRC